ncbi:FliG C-terminal domain-containing protein [Paracoccus sp. KR1-242]|uniref:FliG C-terminal domain-containing protein n=1 Tax=Paracoccus sp. KR1-242 TaxID=3410028 RepID=UPI003BFB5621
MTANPALSARQKAAIIVRLALAEGDDLDLSGLPAAAQTDLAQEMALMGLVDRETRNAVVAEFCDRLEAIGLSFPGDIDGTLNLLDGHLSAETSDRLRRLAALNGTGDPWDRIAMLSPVLLAELARTEAVEIAAVMFSKLPVPRAAEVFGLIEPDRSRQIAYAMSLTGTIESPALNRIGLALIRAADAIPRPAIEGKAAEKIGAILNVSSAQTRDDVLSRLENEEPEFAGEVRKTIFTWLNIPNRVDSRDLPRIIREMDPAVLVRAFAGAKAEYRATMDFFLRGLSTRLAESMRDEVEVLGNVAARDAEEAMDAVVATIRRMEAAGDLFLITPLASEDQDGELS